jgi:iron complex outermembrane receptor protein
MAKYNLLAGGALCSLALAMPFAAQAQSGGVPPSSSHEASAPSEPAIRSAESNARTADGGVDPNNILTEIIVTGARRRSESVQSVPLAITALNQAAIERNHISGLGDIARLAPNLVIYEKFSTANQAAIFLRGFGSFSNDPSVDPPIALYVDGIYQPMAIGTGLDMFGVESIEVERGPQGTLLGKNAPTGAISITSKRPTGEWGGAGAVSYERFDRKDIKGRVDIPVIPGLLAVNASLVYKKGGDYIRGSQFNNRRLFGGVKGVAARIGALFTPTDNFEILVQLNGQNTRNSQPDVVDFGYLPQNGPYQAPSYSCATLGFCSPPKRFVTNSNIAGRQRSDDRQAAVTATWKLTPLTITSVTGYKTLRDTAVSDCDGSVATICTQRAVNTNYDQFSQEVRLSSAENGGLDLDGRLDWVLGGFYSNFWYDGDANVTIQGNNLVGLQTGSTKSYALFGHFVYKFTDRLNATVGVRQSWDDKTHSYRNYGSARTFVDAPLSFKKFSKEAGLQYKFTPSQMVFFRYAEGYRSGGYQGKPAANIQIPYRPETVKSYELGLKADFLDHRLRTNLVVFQNDYKDLQRFSFRSLPVAPFFANTIQNAAAARVRGIELETTVVPVDALTLAFSATYLQPKYKSFIASLFAGLPPQDLSTFPFPNAPKYTVKFAPQYVADLGGAGKLLLSSDLTYATSYYTSDVPYPLARVRPLAILNASMKWEDPSDRYYVEVYGRNLTNRYYINQFSTSPTRPGSVVLTSIGARAKPITWGVGAGFKF